MPITRKQFEMGIDNKTEEWMGKIQTYLCEHIEEAFSKEELRQYFGTTLVELLEEHQKRIVEQQKNVDAFYFLPDEKSAFNSALGKLVETDDIEVRIIRDVYYYSGIEVIEL